MIKLAEEKAKSNIRDMRKIKLFPHNIKESLPTEEKFNHCKMRLPISLMP